VHCQLDYLSDCLPGRIRHALDELPPTLDATYERTLREIKETNWEFARRLLLCVAAASRPLLVEELAEFLAFDFTERLIPKFREDWRLEDPADAVLSTCPTFLSLVNSHHSQVIQFSHFSVKEFLMSSRLASTHDTISLRYHISMTPAHTLVAQACLGILLHLDNDVTKDSLAKFSLAEYAAEHWLMHARFEGVSANVDEGMKRLFDRKKPHLSIWLWICDPTVPSWKRKSARGVLPPRGTPLHYAAFCGLYDVVEVLAIDNSQDVNSRSFDHDSTPLHLASKEEHVKVARFLVEHGADAAAKDSNGRTPLHWVSEGGDLELARLLIEHGAEPAAQDWIGRTPLHRASERGDVEFAWLLIEHGADAAAQASDGRTPLHRASERGYVELARLLVEHGADVAALDEDQWTPLHRASFGGHMELVRLLIEHGADVEARNSYEWTLLHQASARGDMELARLLLEYGADATAEDPNGWTALHRASKGGHLDIARLLVEHGADVAVEASDAQTSLHWASRGGHLELAQLLIQHGADAAAQDLDMRTPLHWAFERGHLKLVQLLVKHGAEAAVQDSDGGPR
jgi:ankyrin repeat protein